MNDVVKSIAKKSGIVAMDSIVAAYDNKYNQGAPILAATWGLTKATVGSALILRQKKGIEWLEMMEKELPHLKQEILESEEFQDTFATSFEAYLKERDAEKRILLRNIFIDYTSVENPEIYPIERYYEITRQITIYESKVLSKLIHDLQLQSNGSIKASPDNMESVLHLMSLGLLIEDTTPVTINPDGIGPRLPKVFTSKLGEKYVTFMKETDTVLQSITNEPSA